MNADDIKPVKTVTVKFDVLVFADATDKEIQGWLNFELGETCSLNGTNPLCHCDLAAVRGSVRIVG